MTAYLADTNIVSRRILLNDPLHAIVRAALDTLRERRELVYICPQVLVEFQALATRPPEANGLGMLPADVSAQARTIETLFPLLPEIPAIYSHWRRLVDTYAVVGRQVFDARLVAVMLAYGVTHLLTLNPTHFQRYVPEGVTVMEPHAI